MTLRERVFDEEWMSEVKGYMVYYMDIFLDWKNAHERIPGIKDVNGYFKNIYLYKQNK